MIARIRGHTSIFDLNLEDRCIKLKERDVRDSLNQSGAEFLLEVFSQETSPVDETGLGLPLFRRGCRTRPAMKCNSYEDFNTRFNRLTGGLVQEIADVPGIVFAGGSVVGTLTRGAIGDVDIFLTCPLEQAQLALQRVYNAIQTLHGTNGATGRKVLVTRSRCAVTFYRISDGRLAALPVQVILSLNESALQILSGFDIDSCCFAYIPGKGVFASPRGMRALRYGVNVFDSDSETPTYCPRLEKWDGRGYAIALPGLVYEKISQRMRGSTFFTLPSGDVILRADRPNVSSLQVSAGSGPSTVSEAVTERCRVLAGFERLVAKKIGKTTSLAKEHCTPIVFRQNAILVWGGLAPITQDHDEQEAEYSATPIENVQSLLRSVSARTADNGGEQGSEFQWWLGGAFCRSSKKPVVRALNQIDADVYRRIAARSTLHFVYDLVDIGTAFNDLKFTLNAGHSPLRDLPDELFEDTFGLSKTLSFRMASKKRVAQSQTDLWSVLY